MTTHRFWYHIGPGLTTDGGIYCTCGGRLHRDGKGGLAHDDGTPAALDLDQYRLEGRSL